MSLFKNLNFYACGELPKMPVPNPRYFNGGNSIAVQFFFCFFEKGGKENEERLLKTGTVEERIGREKVEDQREDEEEGKEEVAEHRKRSRRREKNRGSRSRKQKANEEKKNKKPYWMTRT